MSIGLLRESSDVPIATVVLTLVQCVPCGHVFNARFDDAKIREAYTSERYVVKKNVSTTMNKVEGRIFAELRQLSVHGTHWLEVGSGNGALANQLAAVVGSIVTIDPSPASEPDSCPPNRTHRRAFFTHGHFSTGEFNGIVFRHLLEHVADPNAFIASVAEILAPGGHVYVEVPDFTEVHDHGRFMDVFHDHFSYFTRQRLEGIFAEAGFQVVTRLTFYEGQHQGMVFKKATARSAVASAKPARLSGDQFRRSLTALSDQISRMPGRRLAVWGAGAHGNALGGQILSLMGADQGNAFTQALDADPSKKGKYLASIPARIDSPDRVDLNALDGIVVASALHEPDIVAYLASRGYPGSVLLTAKEVKLNAAHT